MEIGYLHDSAEWFGHFAKPYSGWFEELGVRVEQSVLLVEVSRAVVGLVSVLVETLVIIVMCLRFLFPRSWQSASDSPFGRVADIRCGRLVTR